MLFEVVGTSFIMMCMVAYTAYWGGTKSAIGSVVASGCSVNNSGLTDAELNIH